MANKFKSVLGGAGFYTVLALCVMAVGIGGYFLLFERSGAAETEDPPQAETSAPAPDIIDESPSVETVSPEAMETDVPDVSMPVEKVPIDDTPVIAEAPQLVVSPLQGTVVAAFSVDELVYNETLEDWRTHDGVDIAAQQGTAVTAACAGTVLSISDDTLMGTTVVLEHQDGYQTTYANLQSKPTVSEGESVSAGQVIGAVGTTASAESAQGPHLHFSVTKDGDAVNPDDFLNK
ncbi:Peptidase family M23 [Oscillibacter sp. PC13]|uniref:M23 family metallopeptidase n=1 Tax=Oscillibacter sp. PC13 TaxID=1855299 RepID=UPI0008ED19CD|nr:M23 family metallopeptidase [Oscillibacter sp. PC13]SFP27518.1 Peptidase family M23 [Oscillibacter sp. PC13]